MGERADVLIIGSGAGGAVTAHCLAAAGFDVTVLEEGGRFDLSDYGGGGAAAMQRLYRRRGMTPIVGRVPIGYVEGACVGGSTEINTGFWHRTPTETLLRWKAQYDLPDATDADLRPHFDWAEELLRVAPFDGGILGHRTIRPLIGGHAADGGADLAAAFKQGGHGQHSEQGGPGGRITGRPTRHPQGDQHCRQ
jgi:choline dehydrogenase-like flavoprotein